MHSYRQHIMCPPTHQSCHREALDLSSSSSKTNHTVSHCQGKGVQIIGWQWITKCFIVGSQKLSVLLKSVIDCTEQFFPFPVKAWNILGWTFMQNRGVGSNVPVSYVRNVHQYSALMWREVFENWVIMQIQLFTQQSVSLCDYENYTLCHLGLFGCGVHSYSKQNEWLFFD